MNYRVHLCVSHGMVVVVLVCVMGCGTIPMGVDEQTGSPTSGLMSRGLPIGCAYKSKRSWRSDSVGLTDRASDVGNA